MSRSTVRGKRKVPAIDSALAKIENGIRELRLMWKGTGRGLPALRRRYAKALKELGMD